MIQPNGNSSINSNNHNNAPVWLERGQQFEQAGQYDQALDAYARAIDQDDTSIESILARAKLRNRLLHFEEVMDDYHRLIALRPTRQHHFMLATGYYRLGLIDEAVGRMRLVKQGLQTLPPHMQFLDAVLDLKVGRLKQGFQKYTIRSQLDKGMRLDGSLSALPWNGENLENKSILIHDEQGFGDLFQFCRYLQNLIDAGAQVTFKGRGATLDLLAHSFPGLKVTDRITSDMTFDYQALLLDLPQHFVSTPEQLTEQGAYLSPTDEAIAAWQNDVPENGKLKVGLCWQGNEQNFRNRLRSLDFDHLLPLFDLKRIELFSLQKDVTVQGCQGMRQYGDRFTDFSMTAGLIHHLDLIISVETAVAHLSAAMGKPVWIPLDKGADWRWQNDADTCWWYESMRTLQQDKLHDWSPVLERLSKALKQRLSEQKAT